jgi:glycosyltransferase involved in cell wall biosynthesis
MIRAAVVIDSLKVGGAQRLVSAYAANAAAHGIAPIVITLREQGSPLIQDSIRAAGIEVISLQAPSLLNWSRFRKLEKTLKEKKVEIVHSHLVYSNILATLAAHRAGLPVIATLHSVTDRGDWKSKILKRIESFVLGRYATRILAVGRRVADVNRERYGRRRVDVIPNGIPKPQFPTVRECEDLRHEIAGHGTEAILITVGRFSTAKGYEDLIEALHLLRRRQRHLKLLMVGSGSTLARIKRQIEELDLAGSVILTGEREDVHHLLASSDVYASSSHREGLPLAVLEAMMAGLPVVATSVGDLPSVVTEQTGVLVPPHRPELLADALEALLDDPKKRQAMGQAAYRRAMDEFSLEVWMKRHHDLYYEVLSSNGHGKSK